MSDERECLILVQGLLFYVFFSILFHQFLLIIMLPSGYFFKMKVTINGAQITASQATLNQASQQGILHVIDQVYIFLNL